MLGLLAALKAARNQTIKCSRQLLGSALAELFLNQKQHSQNYSYQQLSSTTKTANHLFDMVWQKTYNQTRLIIIHNLIYMNKAELATHLAEKSGLPKKQVEELLEMFVETVISTLKSGGEVTITGFGSFMAKTRAARSGVNPQHPEQKIQIAAVTVPKFKAGKNLKEALK